MLCTAIHSHCPSLIVRFIPFILVLCQIVISSYILRCYCFNCVSNQVSSSTINEHILAYIIEQIWMPLSYCKCKSHSQDAIWAYRLNIFAHMHQNTTKYNKQFMF